MKSPLRWALRSSYGEGHGDADMGDTSATGREAVLSGEADIRKKTPVSKVNRQASQQHKPLLVKMQRLRPNRLSTYCTVNLGRMRHVPNRVALN